MSFRGDLCRTVTDTIDRMIQDIPGAAHDTVLDLPKTPPSPDRILFDASRESGIGMNPTIFRHVIGKIALSVLLRTEELLTPEPLLRPLFDKRYKLTGIKT